MLKPLHVGFGHFKIVMKNPFCISLLEGQMRFGFKWGIELKVGANDKVGLYQARIVALALSQKGLVTLKYFLL